MLIKEDGDLPAGVKVNMYFQTLPSLQNLQSSFYPGWAKVAKKSMKNLNLKKKVWRMVWRWCGKGVKPSLSVCQSGDEARNPPTPLYYTNIHRTNWQRAILKIYRFFWKIFTRQAWYNQPHQTNLPWTINCEQEPRANLVMTQEMLTPLHYTNHYTITPLLHYNNHYIITSPLN